MSQLHTTLSHAPLHSPTIQESYNLLLVNGLAMPHSNKTIKRETHYYDETKCNTQVL